MNKSKALLVEDDAGGDCSSDSLGAIPNGPLTTRNNPLNFPGWKARKNKGTKMSLAGQLLKLLGKNEDASQYDACLKLKQPLNSAQLPEIKNAVINAVGSSVDMQYDTEKNCFYVDATPELLAKVKQVLSTLSIQIDDEPVAAPDPTPSLPMAAPAEAKKTEPDTAPMSVQELRDMIAGKPDAEDAKADLDDLLVWYYDNLHVIPSGDEAQYRKLITELKGYLKDLGVDEDELDNGDDGEEGDDSDVNGDDDLSNDDGAIIDNGRLIDIVQRIQTKVERLPAIKRGYYYRILLRDVISSVEDKSGAPVAILGACRDFLKTQL